ncbi:MAG: type II toxin-antitoxin system death-on-curing family toxin [Planctomycetes bacterium]|nr:type II toxin-antitoxin system death-on-curing family toxin [Planctomycetota bacterium]
MPLYLSLDEVVEINRDVMKKYGGVSRIRDKAALESCIALPTTIVFGYERFGTLAEKAAAYCFFISQNQPFQDGNKRTAFASALHFLHLNTDLRHINEIEMFETIVAVAEHSATIEDLTKLFDYGCSTPEPNENAS